MDQISIYFWSFMGGVFGAVVGSYLNVIIYRLPREALTVGRPRRSYCPACGKFIPWYDNLPILSYLRLEGCCRYCGGRISSRYLWVEILTFLLFAALTFRWAPILLETGPDRLQWFGIYFLFLYLIATAIVVTFIDLEFKIIPNEITYLGMILAPLICTLLPRLQSESRLFFPALNPNLAGLLSSLGGGLVGGGTLLVVGYLGKRILKREALGMGDVKLMFFVGGVFGWEGGLIVFFLGCLFGSLVGIPFRVLTGKQEIPFGPFLSLGLLVQVFFASEIMEFLIDRWPKFVASLFH
jgi:leader peptidase (prepilin peptidase)/N-methyltransferase